MSLLLDARNKQTLYIQQGGTGRPEMQPCPEKPPAAPAPDMDSRRNMIAALSGMLLAAGAGYLAHVEPAGNNPHITTPMPHAVATTPTRIAPAIIATAADARPTRPIRAVLAVVNSPAPRMRIEPQSAGLADPLPGSAYLAYRSGKLDDAQKLYGEMLTRDAHNVDALLGLAAIAQHRGDEMAAAQHYTRVLALDPRNASANAGMSALSADEQNENHLKTLLDEQRGSASLHFALGNHYAGQSRWGEAQQSYFSALALNPDNAQFAFNLAISLDHLGQDRSAAQHYLRALQLDQANMLDHAQIERRMLELGR